MLPFDSLVRGEIHTLKRNDHADALLMMISKNMVYTRPKSIPISGTELCIYSIIDAENNEKCKLLNSYIFTYTLVQCLE